MNNKIFLACNLLALFKSNFKLNIFSHRPSVGYGKIKNNNLLSRVPSISQIAFPYIV